ncbi:hypothetical protein M513_06734 [Trichuris suis]|uniref:Transporter n=1 Tax=Trichuris suis TaxID=68888 RepID=A0A085M557_9BILA|nr:hypothetical protein M513_06734 [Trichuris suis]
MPNTRDDTFARFKLNLIAEKTMNADEVETPLGISVPRSVGMREHCFLFIDNENSEAGQKPADRANRTVNMKEAIATKEKWASATEFMLSCLGYAVGLGNIWRFPYLCGRNGGAAFLIIFIIIIIIGGIPMAYLELGMGQYSSLGPHKLFHSLCPLFSGLGYVMVTTSFLISLYYNVVLSWAIYYFVVSFSSELPWMHCDNPWNTEACLDDALYKYCIREGHLYWKGRCVNQTEILSDDADAFMRFINSSVRTNPADEFYQQVTLLIAISAYSYDPFFLLYSRRVLRISDGIDRLGSLNWQLALTLLAAWVLVFGILIRGVKSMGKVVYFLATVPYILLIALLVRGLLLPNSSEGLKFFLVPDFSRLADSSVWGDAAIQVFFSMSIGAGGLSTLASYNRVNNNILRDTMVITLGNIVTSILSGLVVFSILGYIAGEFNVSVASVADSGPGLLFIAYPYALAGLPVSQLWSCMFFFAVILMALDTQIVQVEVVITAIVDHWPRLRDPWPKVATVAAVCSTLYLLGLPMVTQGGPYVLNLLDTFAGGWPLLLQCLVEVLLVAYVYGLKRYAKLYRVMLGDAPSKFWKLLGYPISKYYEISWGFTTPLSLLGVLIFNFLSYSITTYGSYVYPVWAEVIGWIIAFGSCSPVVIVAVYKLIKIISLDSTIDAKARIRQQLKETDIWHQNFKMDVKLAELEKHDASHVAN